MASFLSIFTSMSLSKLVVFTIIVNFIISPIIAFIANFLKALFERLNNAIGGIFLLILGIFTLACFIGIISLDIYLFIRVIQWIF